MLRKSSFSGLLQFDSGFSAPNEHHWTNVSSECGLCLSQYKNVTNLYSERHFIKCKT